jgi:phosphate/sulfate permease
LQTYRRSKYLKNFDKYKPTAPAGKLNIDKFPQKSAQEIKEIQQKVQREIKRQHMIVWVKTIITALSLSFALYLLLK